MLVTAEDIRFEQDVANNIADTQRLSPYIDKAEREWVINAIGVKNYKRLEQNDYDEVLTLLMNGGYYNDDTIYFAGLRKAIIYLAYSLFVRNDNVFSTQSGFRYKGNADFSDRVDDKTIVRVAKENEARGIKALNECVSFLNSQEGGCSKRRRLGNTTLRVIGN